MRTRRLLAGLLAVGCLSGCGPVSKLQQSLGGSSGRAHPTPSATASDAPNGARSAHAVPADRYLTIFFGRTQWQPSPGCTPLKPEITLEDAVKYAHSQGFPVSGGVTLDYVSKTAERHCRAFETYPTWTDLERLRSRYGFEAVSQSRTYDDWLDHTTEAQFYSETCGTLPELQRRGFDRAWGMFAYPNNVQAPMSVPLVNSCFAFGRSYSPRPNDPRWLLNDPYSARTLSITSGRCNNPKLECSKGDGPQYMTPESFKELLNPDEGTYTIVQFYRFVTGTGKTPKTSWDCTGKSTQDHWITTPEVYCYNDFQAALGMIGKDVKVTDPATVATAWGRVPAFVP